MHKLSAARDPRACRPVSFRPWAKAMMREPQAKRRMKWSCGEQKLAAGYAPGRKRMGEGGQRVRVRAGEMAVFFPQDAHKPNISLTDGHESGRKIVVKVRLD